MAKRRSNGQGTLFKRVDNGPWTAAWFDHTGRRRIRSTRTTDRRAAEQILAKFVADAALRRAGVIDPRLDKLAEEAKRDLDGHIAAYEAHLQAGHRADKHVSSTIGYIRAMATDAGWITTADISVEQVNRFAQRLSKHRRRSARTVHAYLTAMKGFTRWLMVSGKIASDPLISVSKPNPKTDRRRERRMLLPEEWEWLRATTAEGPHRYRNTGWERVLIYATAIQTGLRQNELRSLTRGRLYLDHQPPFITVKAGATKNAKDARQYIQPDLATQLAEYVATKAPASPVFELVGGSEVADMLRADLADARQAWLEATRNDLTEYPRRLQSDFLKDINSEGERLDFHALRHTCGAWLALSGAHPKAVQAVMRHSTITLTMDTYGHLFPGQEAETVARLPQILGDSITVLRPTGTNP